MSKIEPIENPDRRNSMRDIGRRLFQPHDTCEGIVKPTVEACLMFHVSNGTDRDYLTKEQYATIIAAAKHVGDTGFVLSTLSGIFAGDPNRRYYTSPPGAHKEVRIEVDGQDVAEYYWCEFPPYNEYLNTAFVAACDTAVFSINARWGVYTCREYWQLVGGNIDFIEQVDKLYPAWRNGVIRLIDECEGTIARGMPIGDVLVNLLDWWKKYPGGDWAETVTAKLDRKLAGGL